MEQNKIIEEIKKLEIEINDDTDYQDKFTELMNSFGWFKKESFISPELKSIEPMKVESSNIDSVLYSGKDETLNIIFKGGASYLYEGVNQSLFEEFLNSESKGKFFHAKIKEKRFIKLKTWGGRRDEEGL